MANSYRAKRAETAIVPATHTNRPEHWDGLNAFAEQAYSNSPLDGLAGGVSARCALYTRRTYAQTAPTFSVRSYVGKCLDFGSSPQVIGSPVFISDCNGKAAQMVRVQEINDRHEVILRAGTKVIGVKDTSVIFPAGPTGPAAGPPPDPETPLELQNEASRLTVLSARQVFALDGDSIILAANRNRVVKVQGGRGRNGTPLVVGHRDLVDFEFWTFSATDGTAHKLTSGFVRVPQETDFFGAILQAKWGTVIDVDPDASIDLGRDHRALIHNVPAGVTIRGGRRGVLPGAEIFSPFQSDPHNPFLTQMLVITGSDVRITGLRLRGPSRGRDHKLQPADGILTDSDFDTIIDHNDMSDWTNSAVHVDGGDELASAKCPFPLPPTRPEKVRVVRNFLHHNERWSSGYGVVMVSGGSAVIEGNTFVSNRHAIADDGTALSGYRAFSNLVLTNVPTYSGSESDTTFGSRATARF